MTVAYLFPGQGSQMPSMLNQLPNDSVIHKTIEEANELLEDNLLIYDSESALKSTKAVQICLLVAGVSTARALMNLGAYPNFVAGHSVGAFSAAVVAGVLSFADALALVRLRGELMETTTPSGYGMGVVVGLTEKQLTSIVSSIHTKAASVYITNRNSIDQLTVSGSVDAIKKTLENAKQAGARKAEKLQVSVPSHCPLFSHISTRIAEELNLLKLHEPIIPYMSNRRARRLNSGKEIVEDLALSISHPVQWHDVTTTLYELGVNLFVEMPPGQVLSDLSKQAFPDVRSIAVSSSGLHNTHILVNRANPN